MRVPWKIRFMGFGLWMVAGCALTPASLLREQERVQEAGFGYEAADRVLPDLPEEPTWQDLLERAFLANGDLEAAYFRWKGAVGRVSMVSAYPNTNLMLGYGYMFSRERMKSFDRSTFSALTDSMKNLSFPTKVMKAGDVALEEARVSGERFRAAKFDLQARVLGTWSDYVMAAERVRLSRRALGLAVEASEAARRRTEAGATGEALLEARIDLGQRERTVELDDAEVRRQRVMLNGLLAREPDSTLGVPSALPAPRPVPRDDRRLLELGVEADPELAAWVAQTRARDDALELARLQWIPDLNPSLVFSGSAAQALGAAIVLPTTIAEIRGGIAEAESMLRETQAMARQARAERSARFVGALVTLRNAERVGELLTKRISPESERLVRRARERYVAAGAEQDDVIRAEQAVLEVRLAIVEAWALRERSLAELEALAGRDVETLADVPVAAESHDLATAPAAPQEER